MATPIGHALAGAWVGIASRRPLDLRLLGLGCFMAIAPDLDFVPGLLIGDPPRFHHAYSHSMSAAFLAALIVWAAGPRAVRLRLALITLAAYGSHLLLDLFTLDDSPPHGIPLLWPVSEARFDIPLYVFPNVIHGTGIVHWQNVEIAATELILLGLPLLLLRPARSRLHGLLARLFALGSQGDGHPTEAVESE